jgi:hypothetical protein
MEEEGSRQRGRSKEKREVLEGARCMYQVGRRLRLSRPWLRYARASRYRNNRSVANRSSQILRVRVPFPMRHATITTMAKKIRPLLFPRDAQTVRCSDTNVVILYCPPCTLYLPTSAHRLSTVDRTLEHGQRMTATRERPGHSRSLPGNKNTNIFSLFAGLPCFPAWTEQGSDGLAVPLTIPLLYLRMHHDRHSSQAIRSCLLLSRCHDTDTALPIAMLSLNIKAVW